MRLSLRAGRPARGQGVRPGRSDVSPYVPARHAARCPGGRQQARVRVPSGRTVAPGDPEIRRTAGGFARPPPGSARLGHPADISTSPSDSARAASRARPLRATNLVLGVHHIHFGPIRPGRRALTVFTSGDGMATPRSGWGRHTGAGPALRACIPSRHPQTPCRAADLTRLPMRGRQPPPPASSRHEGAGACAGAPPDGSSHNGATAAVGRCAARAPAAGTAQGNPAPHHGSSRHARFRAARPVPRRDSGRTERVPCAVDALSVGAGRRPHTSAHSATSRTKVSGWSDR